jgi:hypothetical protein
MKLKKLDFEYTGKRSSDVWVFSRKSGDAVQYICFEKFNAPTRLRVQLHTSICLERRYLHDLSNAVDFAGVRYDDQNSLNLAIEILTDIIVDKGIDWLNIMSVADIVPSHESFHDFKDKLNLSSYHFSEISSLDINDSNFLNQLQELVLQRSQNGDKQPDWDFIVEGAIKLSHYIQRRFGGEWSFDDKEHYVLTQVGGKQKVTYNPLLAVSKYWGKPFYPRYSLNISVTQLESWINISRS